MSHTAGTSLQFIIGAGVTVETTAFTCKACGAEFKATRTGTDGEWVVIPYVFEVKKKRLSAEQPKLTWK